MKDKGVTYDTEPKEFVIVVADDGAGSLKIKSVTGNGHAEAKNAYSSEGEITFSAEKILVRRTLNEGEFSFQLKDEDGNVLRTAECDSEGKVTFDPITYSEDDMKVDGEIVTTREYTYYISEVKPENADDTVIYDPTVKEIKVTLQRLEP